jgi:hypothetical protein
VLAGYAYCQWHRVAPRLLFGGGKDLMIQLLIIACPVLCVLVQSVLGPRVTSGGGSQVRVGWWCIQLMVLRRWRSEHASGMSTKAAVVLRTARMQPHIRPHSIAVVAGPAMSS